MDEDHTEENLADPKVEDPPESREEELGAIFDKANAEETAEEPTKEPAKDDDAGERARGPDGKFIAKDATEEGAEAEEQTDQGAEVEEEAAPQALDPPASWSEAAKAGWPNIDPVLQAEFLKREADWQTADGERATKLKGYEPITQALEPVRQFLELNGVEPANYVRQLVAADQYLKTDPVAGIQWLAQQFGVDLSQVTQAESDVDPAVAPLVKEINSLKSQVTGFITSQQQAEASNVQTEIQKFSVDHPHFAEVRTHMGALMQAGAASDMQDAYDQAVWANPVTRAKVQAENSVETETKRKEKAAAKAAKAKRVSETNLSNQGSAGGATPKSYDSREDELGDLYDQVQGAA